MKISGRPQVYLESPVRDWTLLTHQLVESSFGYCSFPLSVDVSPMGRPRRSAVYRHPKSNSLVVGCRSQDEMQICRMKPKDDFARRSIKYRSFIANRPCPNQPPLIEFKPGRYVVHSRYVVCQRPGNEVFRLLITDRGFWRL